MGYRAAADAQGQGPEFLQYHTKRVKIPQSVS